MTDRRLDSVVAPGRSGPERLRVERAVRHRAAWQRQYALRLVVVDTVAVALAVFLAYELRFGDDGVSVEVAGSPGLTYGLLSVAFGLLWLGLLGLQGAYDARVVGLGPEEYKRVLRASLWLVALVATVSYLLRVDIARGWLAIALPVGTALVLLGRYGTRRRLHAARGRGHYVQRVLAVGDEVHVAALAAALERESYAGYRVVGACLADPGQGLLAEDVRIVGSTSNVRDSVLEVGADTVAVASLSGTEPEFLRRLSWSLEGLGVDMVVAPSLTDVAGPRIHVRPLSGLPLLHVDEPELTGVRRLGKTLVDVVGGLVLGALLTPVMLVAALAIRLDDRGPVFFRQVRVGERGRRFTMYKLRTMTVGADEKVSSLEELNESDGALFKIRHDPRITRVGRVLRRWSLDEVPQLLNVLRREMSLVGPRPPLPREVARYSMEAQRRLLVRPGMTGLWQISGRADLTWDDSVRLDLWYVENWSFSQDLVILGKTVRAVLDRRGAY